MGKNGAISAVCNKNAHPKTIRLGVRRAIKRESSSHVIKIRAIPLWIT